MMTKVSPEVRAFTWWSQNSDIFLSFHAICVWKKLIFWKKTKKIEFNSGWKGLYKALKKTFFLNFSPKLVVLGLIQGFWRNRIKIFHQKMWGFNPLTPSVADWQQIVGDFLSRVPTLKRAHYVAPMVTKVIPEVRAFTWWSQNLDIFLSFHAICVWKKINFWKKPRKSYLIPAGKG